MKTENLKIAIQFCTNLLDLESEVREASSLSELEYLMVNRGQHFLDSDVAVAWSKNDSGKAEICKVSNIDEIDTFDSPLIQCIEQWLSKDTAELPNKTTLLHNEALKQMNFEEYFGWKECHAMWCPISFKDENTERGIVFFRQKKWEEKYYALASRLTSMFAYALRAMLYKGNLKKSSSRLLKKPVLWFIAVTAICFIPVQQSVLGDAIVTAKNPAIITAPLNGVIESVSITPNQYVETGDVLFEYEKADLKNEYHLSATLLEIEKSKLFKAQQQAFSNNQIKSSLSVIENQIEQRKIDQNFAREQLDRGTVKSSVEGLAIIEDVQSLIGKPVQIGEKVLTIAKEDQVELEIHLAVEDAIIMDIGSEVSFFVHSSPMFPIDASVSFSSYQAELLPEGILAFRLKADLLDTEEKTSLRIGQRGTAKIYGDRVSLFFYIFRRPISYLRQNFGI